MDYNIVLKDLVNNFRDKFIATKQKKAIIGISGGIDSALVASIACSALGNENVLGYFLPFETTVSTSYDDAQALSKSLGFKLETINISSYVLASFNVLNIYSNNSQNENDDDYLLKLRKGNIMSRMRMVTLFDKAQEHYGIVIGTTNRTELLLGYGTWYGDMASSINPIGNLYKREVYDISKIANVPESIINKDPSADLWPGQKDEDEIGYSYDVLDNIFYDIEVNNLNKEDLIHKYGINTVLNVVGRAVRNRFKRDVSLICEVNIDNRTKIDEKLLESLL